MSQPVITKVEMCNVHDVENRYIEITFEDGTVTTAEACHGSWEQWGPATTDHQWAASPICDKYNDWLHGGQAPAD